MQCIEKGLLREGGGKKGIANQERPSATAREKAGSVNIKKIDLFSL
jgi:hypothetical protein